MVVALILLMRKLKWSVTHPFADFFFVMSLGAEDCTVVPLEVSNTYLKVYSSADVYGDQTSMSIRPLIPLIGIAMKLLVLPLSFIDSFTPFSRVNLLSADFLI